MAFPSDPLDVTVGLAFGADPGADPATFTFTDVTADAEARVVIRRGRQNEGADRLDPGYCSLRLGNDGGIYTPYNPSSIHWPNIRPDTPMQVKAASSVRATQFVADWQPGFADGGGGPWEGAPICDVGSAGVLRRLGQGASPLRSPLFRRITTATTLPVAYWPLEDGVDSTQAASGLVGGSPMTVQTGQIDFIDAGPTGSAGAANLSLTVQGVIVGTVSGAGTAWQVGFWARGTIADPNTPAIPSTLAYVAPIEIHTSSPNMGSFLPFLQAAVSGSPRPGLEIGIYDQPGGTFITALSNANEEPPGQLDGEWHFVQITAQQVGADVNVAAYLDGVLAEAATLTGKTVGFPTSVRGIGISGPLSDVVGNVGEAGLSTVTVYDNAAPVDHYTVGSAGHAGEAAHERIERLCGEEGVSVTVPAVSVDFEAPMGPQSTGTLLELLRECEQADQGVLYETITGGLGYQPREDRYNRAVDLQLAKANLASGFHPTADDQITRNDVTVSRTDGSSARYTDEAHIAVRGRYDEFVTINAASDGVLLDHAAWRVHLGTAEDLRYPKITLNLHSDPDLIPAWLACDIGSRITITEAPASMPPGPVDLIIDGYIETLDAFEWTVTLNCSPASPWDVGVYGTSRYDTAGCRLNGPIASGSTTVAVLTTLGSPLSPTAVPFDVNVGGERWTVTAVTGTGTSQTLTVTRSVNGIVKAHATATPVRLWTPAIYAF